MEQNLFNQNQPQPIQPSNWFTTEQVSIGFECTSEGIRACKFDNKDKLIEGIHWKKAAVSTETGAKYNTIWSEAGILKLSELMDRTQKAQDFVVEMRVQEELKKRMVKLPDFNNPIAAARAWADECEAKTKALALIEEQKPKVEFADIIIGHKGNFSVKEFIDNFKIIIGKNKFLEILRNDGFLMDYPNKNHPYQQYSKYFKIQRVIKNKKPREATLITPEGYFYLSRKYQNLMQKIEVDYLIEN